MNYRHRYTRQLIRAGKHHDAVSVMMTAPLPDDLPLIKRIISTRGLNTNSRSDLANLLIDIQTPPAMDLLFDHLLDVTLSNIFIVRRIKTPYIYDERFIHALEYALTTRARTTVRWQSADVTLFNVVGKVKDIRFVDPLNTIIETHKDDFKDPFMMRVSIAGLAMRELSRYSEAIVSDRVTAWRDYQRGILQQLIDDDILSIETLKRRKIHGSSARHPFLVDHLLALITSPANRANHSLVKSVLNSLLDANKTGASRQRICDVALDIARDRPRSAGSAPMMKVLADHADIRFVDFALECLDDPIAVTACIPILTENAIITDQIIQRVIEVLQSADRYTALYSRKEVIVKCIAYLQIADHDLARRALYDYLITDGTHIHMRDRYRILAQLVPHIDAALETITTDLLQENDIVKQYIYPPLASLKQRGAPLLLAELRHQEQAYGFADNELIKALAHPDFAMAVPHLMQIAIQHPKYGREARQALIGINTEDALEALYVIDQFED